MRNPTIQFHEGDADIEPDALARALDLLLPDDVTAWTEWLLVNANSATVTAIKKAIRD